MPLWMALCVILGIGPRLFPMVPGWGAWSPGAHSQEKGLRAGILGLCFSSSWARAKGGDHLGEE